MVWTMNMLNEKMIITVSIVVTTWEAEGILTLVRCASGCVVECQICNREAAGSNLGRG